MDYFAISDNEFFVSHHGISGMHWGVRRFQPYGQGGYSPKKVRLEKKIEKTKGKIEKNNNKLDKLNNYSNSTRNQRREMKRLGLERRRAKLTKRVEGARTRKMLYNLEPTRRESRAMKKAYKLDKRIARIVKKQNAWKMKVSKLEYRNMKLERKVDKYIRRLDTLEQSAFSSAFETGYLTHSGVKGMKWHKHLKASTQYWLTDQQAANIKAANSNLSDQQRRNINAARPVNPAAQRNGASTLSDQQAKNGAATRSTLSDQQQKNINAPKTEAKSKADNEKVDKLVESVINGNYGNGEERKKRLAKEGYDYAEIQNLVNEKLGSSKRHESEKSKSSESKSMSKSEKSARASEASARSKMAKNSQRRSSAHSKDSSSRARNARRTESVLRSLDARKKQNSRKRKSVKYNYTRANSNYEEIMSGRKLINRLAR